MVSPAWRGETFGKCQPREDEQPRRRSRPGDAISKSHPGRACAQKEPSGSFSYFSEIHLVELFHPRDGAPAPHERGGACGLARVSKPCFDLLADDFLDIYLQRGLQPAEAPCLRGLVWRPGLRIRERIAAARPGRIERDPPHDPRIRLKPIPNLTGKRQDDVGLRPTDLPHQILTQFEAYRQ